MSNPAMEQPTEGQAESLKDLLNSMSAMREKSARVSDIIGDLRRELNNASVLLGQLRDVIGPQAYSYGQHRWQETINQRMADIQKVLK
jgi:Mg2+ and Co2+ transporter CorA